MKKHIVKTMLGAAILVAFGSAAMSAEQTLPEEQFLTCLAIAKDQFSLASEPKAKEIWKQRYTLFAANVYHYTKSIQYINDHEAMALEDWHATSAAVGDHANELAMGFLKKCFEEAENHGERIRPFGDALDAQQR